MNTDYRDERLTLALKQDIARARNLQREAHAWVREGRPWLAVGARAARDDALKRARALRLAIVRGHVREVLVVRVPGQPDRVVSVQPGVYSIVLYTKDGPVQVAPTGKRTPGRCEIWAPAHQAALSALEIDLAYNRAKNDPNALQALADRLHAEEVRRGDHK